MARKEKKYHFIYKTTNLLTGKYYYGMHSSDDLNDGYLGSGKRLKYSINKYGKENHEREIIEFLPDRKSLKEREKEIINLNELTKGECMNLMIGGEGGFISEEQQRYRSSCGGKALGKKLKDNPEFRIKFSKIISDKIKIRHKNGNYNNMKYDNFKNKTHTKETKLKMSKSKKGTGVGLNNSQFGTCWITNGIENKKIKKHNIIPIGWRLGRIINK